MFRKRAIRASGERNKRHEQLARAKSPDPAEAPGSRGASPPGAAGSPPETLADSAPERACQPAGADKRKPDPDEPERAVKFRKFKESLIAPKLGFAPTTFLDMQPNICTDYQKTGYCGYGDSCKFLHIREDMKPPVDEPAHAHKPAQREAEQPNSCPVCSQAFTDPVETKCHHVYCMECFLAHSKTSPLCVVCKKDTGKSAVRIKRANGTGQGSA